jgi:hypothetical protein
MSISLTLRLLPAIAQQESNLCKRSLKTALTAGVGVFTNEGLLDLSRSEEGIEVVARGLRQNYLDKGLQTPEEIMSKYTPSSPGSWAAGVTAFIADME